MEIFLKKGDHATPIQLKYKRTGDKCSDMPNEEQDNRQYTNEQDGWLTVVLELLDNSSNNIIFNNMNQSCNYNRVTGIMYVCTTP